MSRAVLSQRKTPANFPLKGTTALLKTLFAAANGLRGMIGLRVSRQTTPPYPSGFSRHGMFGSAAPPLIARDGANSTRTGGLTDNSVAFTFDALPISRHQRLQRLIAPQRLRVPVQEQVIRQARFRLGAEHVVR